MKKNRLGSDPLSFIKDTSGHSKENEPEKFQSNTIEEELGQQKDKEEEFDEKNSLSIRVEESSVGIGSVAFDGDMSILNSRKIQNALSSGVNDYKEFNVELSRVKKIDSSAFQLLLSTQKEMKLKNKILKLIKPSKEVKNIFNLFGEEQLLKEMIK